MTTMIAVRLAAAAIVVLGGARLALAEAETFDNLSAAVDWTQFDLPAEVPDKVANLVPVIRPATMQCPSSTDTTPTVTVVAEQPVPADWPDNVTFNETGFVCLMSGVPCGFGLRPITATSSHVTVDEKGILTLRCSANVEDLQ